MTASTRMVTLSLVITSWGGTFMATVWRFTLRMRSMPNGSRMIRPGPLGLPRTRPRRNTTPRSYSLSTETIDTTPQMMRAITPRTMRTTTQVSMPVLPVQVVRFLRWALVCHRMLTTGVIRAQIGDRGLGQAARAAGEQPPERVRGQDERQVAEVAEDRHLEHPPDADIGDAVLPEGQGAEVPQLPEDPGAEAGDGQQQHRPGPAPADQADDAGPAAQLGGGVQHGQRGQPDQRERLLREQVEQGHADHPEGDQGGGGPGRQGDGRWVREADKGPQQVARLGQGRQHEHERQGLEQEV